MYLELESALLNHLTALVPAWDIWKPGFHNETQHPYKPDPSKPFIKPHVFETAPLRPAFGHGTLNRPAGIYQIDLYYPTREKTLKPLLQQVDKVVDHFYPRHGRGIVLTFKGLSLTIDQRPRVTSAPSEDACYIRRAVDVRWFAELPPA